jgi:ketosteroid isomerase-like protein
MSDVALDPAVQRLLDATNTEDTEAFLAAFTEDGVVDDWGRRFVGREAIAQWSAGENIGVHARFEVTGVRTEGTGQAVDVQVSGGGFTGPSTFVFEVDGGRVRSMVIRG